MYFNPAKMILPYSSGLGESFVNIKQNNGVLERTGLQWRKNTRGGSHICNRICRQKFDQTELRKSEPQDRGDKRRVEGS